SVWYSLPSRLSSETTYATQRPSGESWGSLTVLSARMSSLVHGRVPAAAVAARAAARMIAVQIGGVFTVVSPGCGLGGMEAVRRMTSCDSGEMLRLDLLLVRRLVEVPIPRRHAGDGSDLARLDRGAELRGRVLHEERERLLHAAEVGRVPLEDRARL